MNNLKLGGAMTALACVFPALARPLDTHLVAADAAWVAHIDMEAALGSSVGKALLANPQDFGAHITDFHEINDELGLDVTKDIRGVTLYGGPEGGDDAVVVITTTAAMDAVIERMSQKLNGFHKVEENGRTLYTWDEHDSPTWCGVERSSLPGERIVVHCEDKAALLAGLDVIAGRGASLAGRERQVFDTGPRPRSFFFAAARTLPGGAMEHMDGAPPALRAAQGGAIDLGESGDELYAELVINAKTGEDATNMVQAAQGMRAMASMALQGEAEGAKILELLNSLNIQSAMNRVTVAGKWASVRVLDGLRAAAAAGKAHDDEPEPE